MYCSKCGKEISKTAKFCPNCGTKIDVNFGTNRPKENENSMKFEIKKDVKIAEKIDGNKTEINRQVGASDKINEIKKKLEPFLNLLRRNRLLSLGLGLFCVIIIIAAIFINLNKDPIIGKWVECNYYINGSYESMENPSYLKNRTPDRLEFFKDGSFKYASGYSFLGTSTGTWENVTKQADEHPVYRVTIDGETGEFFKANRNSLSLRINANEIRIFKRE